ncbi:hypothetical protein WG947_03050 [Pontibacter sp. H259]|uniref:hypothetical protein n=1 Tax=Pontibacter sp. H259 TaxID=3133421 RepID=UPI0030C25E73
MNEEKNSGTITEVILQNDFVTVFYDEIDTIIIRWERQITPEERIDTFLWAQQYSKVHEVKNWLIDDESIFLITEKEKEWVENKWPPLAAEAGIRKIVVYIPEYFQNSIMSLTDFTKRAQKNYDHYGVTQHEVFTDYQVALAWLKS